MLLYKFWRDRLAAVKVGVAKLVCCFPNYCHFLDFLSGNANFQSQTIVLFSPIHIVPNHNLRNIAPFQFKLSES